MGSCWPDISAAISAWLTASHPNSEVKQVRAGVVLRWGTTREGPVLRFFVLHRFNFLFCDRVHRCFVPISTSSRNKREHWGKEGKENRESVSSKPRNGLMRLAHIHHAALPVSPQRVGVSGQRPPALHCTFYQRSKVQEWRGVTHPQAARARGQAYPNPETRTVDPSCVLCRTFALLAREGGFRTRDALPGAWAACARVAGASDRGPAV